jgi:hypothetical protein
MAEGVLDITPASCVGLPGYPRKQITKFIWKASQRVIQGLQMVKLCELLQRKRMRPESLHSLLVDQWKVLAYKNVTWGLVALLNPPEPS